MGKRSLRHWEYLHDLTHTNKTVEEVENKIKIDSQYADKNPVLKRGIALYNKNKPIWHKIIKENYNTKFFKIKTNN